MNLKLAVAAPASAPAPERPRERCLTHGAACLSLRECLALIIGSGSGRAGSALQAAARVLERPLGHGAAGDEETRAFFEALEHSPDSLLDRQPGLGAANRARMLAAFEVARRYATYRADRARESRDRLPLEYAPAGRALARVPAAARTEPREWLGFIPFYGASVGSLCVVERGVRTHVNTEPAALFARVLALRPRAFVLAHNHPSGDPRPSGADLRLTEQVAALAKRLGIPLLGHWVVTAERETWIEAPPS